MLLFSLHFLFLTFFLSPRSSSHVAQQILLPPILSLFHYAFYSFLSFFLPDKHYFSQVSNPAHSPSPLIYRFCCTFYSSFCLSFSFHLLLNNYYPLPYTISLVTQTFTRYSMSLHEIKIFILFYFITFFSRNSIYEAFPFLLFLLLLP